MCERKNVILRDLSRRVSGARDLLSDLCRRDPLISALNGHKSYAIIGGAIRDTLLFCEMPDLFSVELAWPDVDVAVAGGLSQGDEVPDITMIQMTLKTRGLKIEGNTFNGLRVQASNSRRMDVWCASVSTDVSRTADVWMTYLDSVDFGINALAFTWPQGELLLHPRWRQDLELMRVEKLARRSPRRELQPVRAVALATKLRLGDAGGDITLGSRIGYDFRWLATRAPEDLVRSAFRYLRDKVISRRWPIDVVSAFIARSSRCRASSISAAFKAEINDLERTFPREYILRVHGNAAYSAGGV